MADDIKDSIQRFHKCVAGAVLDKETKFSDAVNDCEKTKLNPGIKVQVVSSRDYQGVYMVSPQQKDVPSQGAVGMGCAECSLAKQSISDLKETAFRIEPKKEQCEYPKHMEGGNCVRQCSDDLVFTYPGECIKCNKTCLNCEEYFVNVVVPQRFNDLPKRPFRMDLQKDTCVDRYGCKISSEIYKDGSCIENCKNGAAFEAGVGCVMTKKSCSYIKEKLLKKPYAEPPNWVNHLKALGCNTDFYLDQYVEDYEIAVNELYQYCVSTPNLKQLDSQFVYVTKDGIGEPLVEQCAKEIGMSPKDLEKKIPYFTKFSNYPRELQINLHE